MDITFVMARAASALAAAAVPSADRARFPFDDGFFSTAFLGGCAARGLGGDDDARRRLGLGQALGRRRHRVRDVAIFRNICFTT